MGDFLPNGKVSMTRQTLHSAGGVGASRRIGLALVAGLVALGAPAAKAMLPRAAAEAPAAAVVRPALGFASFGENSILVLQPGSPCTACLTAETKDTCGHAVPSRLLEYTWEGDRPGGRSYVTTDVSDGLPDLERMQPGPDSSLIVSDRQGTLQRIQLGRDQGLWVALRTEPFLSAEHSSKLGLPAGPIDGFALDRAGALVLVYGNNVAWLPAAPGDYAREQVRWLAGKAPGEGKQEPAAATGLLVAVNDDGLVFLIDGQAAAMTWIDPQTLKAGRLPWPGDRFVPVSTLCLGRTLYLAGRKDAKAKATTLHVMRPEGRGYRWESREQVREFGAVLGASREGQLLSSALGGQGFILYNQDPEPAVEAKQERKQESRLAREAAELLARLESNLGKAADATYQDLLKEEAARKQLQRRKEKRRKAKARAAARTEPQEVQGAGAGAASRTLGPLTALRQHPSHFGLKLETPAPAAKAAPARPKAGAGAGAATSAPAGAWSKPPALPAPAKPAPAEPAAAKAEPIAKSEPAAAKAAPAAEASPAPAGAGPKFRLNPHAKPFQPEETAGSALAAP
jgi:hypothetical protein